jgi:tetratricopeptide (TPR) repeat protein
MAYHDIGRLHRALVWTNYSVDYAHEIGDSALMSYVLMRKSNILAETGEVGLGLGLGLADAALRSPHTLTPRLRAVIRRQRANALAMQGEPHACERELAHAATDVSEKHEESENFAGYCGLSYVEMESGNCWIQLGQPQKAIAALERGLSHWPSQQGRDRALCLARLATAHALAGNADAASVSGAAALKRLAQTRSGRTLTQLYELRRQLLPVSNSRPVEDFNELFDAYLATRKAT